MDLNFDADKVTVEYQNGNKVEVWTDGADIAAVLDTIGIAKVIAHFGEGDMLEEITKATAMEHFGLED